MTDDNKVFYVILVIAILFIIYLFWSNSKEKAYEYRPFTQLSTNPATQQNVINTMINQLQKVVSELRQEIIALRQKLTPLIGQQIPENVTTEINNIITSLNQRFQTLNQQLPSLEQQNLTMAQTSRLNFILTEFNNDIRLLNQLLSNFTNQKINLINIPSNVPSASVLPVVAPPISQPSPSAPTFTGAPINASPQLLCPGWNNNTNNINNMSNTNDIPPVVELSNVYESGSLMY